MTFAGRKELLVVDFTATRSTAAKVPSNVGLTFLLCDGPSKVSLRGHIQVTLQDNS